MKRRNFLATALILTGHLAFGGHVTKAKAALDKWHANLGIDRPWDELKDVAKNKKRDRGNLAYVYRRLKSGKIPKQAVLNLHDDLEMLLTLKKKDQLWQSKPTFTDYQNYFQIDVFSLWKRLITGAASPMRWDSRFKEAYYSQADATGVVFEIRLPPAIKKRKTYPLLIAVLGAPMVKQNDELPFIQVSPSGRGIWGYHTISRYDARCVIDFMKHYYPIDRDRIYLTGFSSGATGAMHLATSYPDEFAAVLPMVAFGTDLPLVNLKNLPVAIHHGTEDWTSSICNVRVQYEKLKQLGCPAILREYPNIGHEVPKPHEPLMRWMLKHRRNPIPHTITHQCETPELGRSYWIHIREFLDTHQRAFVKASLDLSVDQGIVRIQPNNVQAFSLDLDLISREWDSIQTIEVDETRLRVKGLRKRIHCRLREGHWRVSSHEKVAKPAKRPYRAGAAANLYQGEPLLIVYGTTSRQPDRTAQLMQAAHKLAAYGGPTYAPMQGRFPVVADQDLTPDQEAHYNLILLGIPDENSVAKAILPDLPIAIRNNMLEVGNRPPLALRDQVLSLLFPHPKHPQRLVYLIAPFTNKDGLTQFSQGPQLFLVGSEGFNRVSQADLVVQNLDHQIGRQIQFDKQWQWIVYPDTDKSIPPRFRDRANLAIAYMKIMGRKSGADYALWWGPGDKGMWGYDFNYLQQYNPDFYTQADFRTQHRFAETMTGGVSGAELKKIWNWMGKKKEILAVPEIQIDSLADEKQYRIHLPMDMSVKLGRRKKALKSPKPGPTISSEEVMTEIFQ